MNILSLFDGMSCGQIALTELGVKIDNYFASEIDSHAIAQTKYNFPDTIHLGDVTKVSGYNLPKIDLLIGGSPCQGFSFAGKQLNFDDPRSVLFFEFVRILKELREVNPNVKFLLENVRMKKESERVITEILGVYPVVINSSLVSAQNRVRLYWSNIRLREEGLFSDIYTDIPQPEDRGIYLKDILEKAVEEKYYISEKAIKRIERKKGFLPKFNPEKTGTLTTKNNSGQLSIDSGTTLIEDSSFIKITKDGNISPNQYKSSCFTAGGNSAGNHSDMDLICVAMRGRTQKNGKTEQQLEPRYDNKTNCLTSVEKDNLILSGTFRTHKADYGFREIRSGNAATIPARGREDGSGTPQVGLSCRVRELQLLGGNRTVDQQTESREPGQAPAYQQPTGSNSFSDEGNDDLPF